MDAVSALADLAEISSQLEAAVVLDGDGAVLAATNADGAATERLARAGLDLLEAAAARFGGTGRDVTELEVALREGSVFAAKGDGLAIVARTGPAPSSGLVLYDLRTCLRAVAEGHAKPKPRRRGAKKTETADA